MQGLPPRLLLTRSADPPVRRADERRDLMPQLVRVAEKQVSALLELHEPRVRNQS